MARIVLFLSLLFSSISLAFSQPITSQTYGFSIEPPVEWKATRLDNGQSLLFDSGDGLTLEVGTVASTSTPMDQVAQKFDMLFGKKGFKENIEKASFSYNEYPAMLGIARSADQNSQVVILWVSTEKYEYWLLGTVTGRATQMMALSLIYSAMDSFSLGAQGRLTSGPITQFEIAADTSNASKETTLDMAGTPISIVVDIEQAQAAQRLVEREALIMSRYKVQDETAFLAWVRYYRFIYRDNYARITQLAQLLQEKVLKDKSPDEIAKLLLTFSQNYYTYVRFTTFSDLVAPYNVLLSKKGDCDAVGLLYIILLNHYNIDSALLLSQQLGHAIVGVKVKMEGVKTKLFEQEYINAEMTTKDPLGSVPVNVVNTSDWFPILFNAQGKPSA